MQKITGEISTEIEEAAETTYAVDGMKMSYYWTHGISKGLQLKNIKMPKPWYEWNLDDELETLLEPENLKVFNSTSASSTCSVSTDIEGELERQTVSMSIVNQQKNSDTHKELCDKWLDEMNGILKNYDVILLRRYIPDLSRHLSLIHI